MKVFAINSSARTGDVSKTEIMLDWLVQGLRREQAEVEVVNIHRKRINYCKGCFTCWTKTPGACVFTKDDMSRELYPKYLGCDLFIMATPLFHYTVNAKMKTFIERTLPMAQPFFELRNGVTTHPLRHEPPPIVVLSVAGFPEMSVFDQLSSYIQFLYKERLVAEIYRTSSEMLGGKMNIKALDAIQQATIQGGRELARQKRITPETLQAMTQPISTFEKMAPMGNLAWKTCIREGVTMGQFQKRQMVPRPDSIETYLAIMRIGLGAGNFAADDYAIEFRFSGEVTGECHLRVGGGKARIENGPAQNPGLVIHTPFDVWMDILTRKADGQQRFMEQKYTVEGDIGLLMKMSAAMGGGEWAFEAGCTACEYGNKQERAGDMERAVNRQLQEAADFLQPKLKGTPEIAVVLGSGLGPLAGMIEDPLSVPYGEIPHFRVSTVSGHAGELISGTLGGRRVICMNGRVHYYEGYSFTEITFPIRLFKGLGVGTLVLTNAVGGIHPEFQPGDLMLVTDHINLLGGNPLIGPNIDELGPRFPDMSEVYSSRLRALALQTGADIGVRLRQGVFAAMTGPSYETPAEIRMLKTLGADAVGMSLVPEAIVANHMGMEILAISCVTNAAAGMDDRKLDHADVQQAAAKITDRFTRLVSRIIERI